MGRKQVSIRRGVMDRARHVCPQESEKASCERRSMKQFGCLKIERRAPREGKKVAVGG